MLVVKPLRGLQTLPAALSRNDCEMPTADVGGERERFDGMSFKPHPRGREQMHKLQHGMLFGLVIQYTFGAIVSALDVDEGPS